MRRRLLASMVFVTVLAVVTFGVPLGVASARLFRGREVNRLQRDATRAAAALPPEGLTGAAIKLPVARGRVILALYDPAGHRIAGVGPAVGGSEVRSAVRGNVSSDRDRRWLAVAIPLQDEAEVVGAARAAVPYDTVAHDIWESWLVMGAFGLAAVLLAGAVARWQAARLVSPVEGVAALAVRLGDGDFAARLAPSGVPELDRATEALNRTAHRLGELVARERAFTADVSHQLNTPLTSLRLGLESALVTPKTDATTAIEQAIAEVDRLQTTVATLLAVARDAQPDGRSVCDVAAVCRDAATATSPALEAAGRSLAVDIPDGLPPARFPADVLREILVVLLDNARVHGAGAVRVVARRAGEGVVIDVTDDGDGITGNVAALFRRRSAEATGHGIGLALARSLAEAYAGRLEVTRAAPHPVFAVGLPGAGTDAEESG